MEKTKTAGRLIGKIFDLAIDWKENKISDIDFAEKQLSLINQFKSDVVNECMEQLLKQLHPMIHKNGYGSDAVPKATILMLPKLLKSNP